MIPDFHQMALLVIDVQERLVKAMPPKVIPKVIDNIDILIELTTDFKGKLVYTEQYPKGLGPTVPSLKNRLNQSRAIRIEKIAFSTLEEPRFVEEILPSLPNDVIITGIETHVCILQTVIDLALDESSGQRIIYVPEDAVCSRQESHWKNALEQMRELDNVLVTNTESLLFQALRDAKHPRFKHYSKRIR